ncbi:YfhO family protein [Virgibacillus soli]|uniref:YfhO family protein n=1 Tax=Paracerasibacillus soli TaxID=480284 RepID=A0ABU5CWM8_9BACI|nr:YfhO family protein [Virgibacillus soli]MDY0410262.1 YfhO family protein [Virgibacillus soli]
MMNKILNPQDNLKIKYEQSQWKSLLIFSFIVALFAHLFFIIKWLDGSYLIGIGDGVSQMLPFKKLLYDEYTSGNFFYSWKFGMGGGTYSELGYYFSTSIVYLCTVVLTYMLEFFHIIQHPTISYWADMMLFMSIIRMTFIIFITTRFFMYLKIDKFPAFIGAILYGTSIIYFRHVVYWEFFADAMLWFPLLLIGVEKIIREKKSGLFILAVAIHLFNNFYFAYISFLLAFIYIIFRWMIPLSKNETSIVKQIKTYLIGGIVGFGMSAVSFIPAVYGFLNNYRPDYKQSIHLLGFPDNILLNGRVILIPTIALLCLFLFSQYKQRIFRFFALLLLLSFVMHYSPIVASVFNGFSAPQYRWEYFMALVGAGLCAISLQSIAERTKREMLISLAGVCILYMIGLIFSRNSSQYIVVATIITVLAWLFVTYKRKMTRILSITVIIIAIFIGNSYQQVKLKNAVVSKDYLTSDAYDGSAQHKLLDKIAQQEQDPFYRIDWMNGVRNNTPIIQDFHGFSVYSSILNKQLLYFYLFDLNIDMGRESVSRYATLGDRSNLYSLLGGKYYMTTKDDQSIPYQFEKLYQIGDYIAYKNNNALPPVRTTATIFAESDLVEATALDKERAMLEGIVINDKVAPIPITHAESFQQAENIIKKGQITTNNASYKHDILQVYNGEGGLDINLHHLQPQTEDLYVSFHIERLDKDKGYTLAVNDYITTRKKNTSIYKTGVNDMTVRITKNSRIHLRLPEGIYKLSNLALYEESYEALAAEKLRDTQDQATIKRWEKNQVHAQYLNKENERFISFAIPYEKGWHAYRNGKPIDILEVNYAFIGLPLTEGNNDIQLVYYPPYFFLSLWTSLGTVVLFILVRCYLRRKKSC